MKDFNEVVNLLNLNKKINLTGYNESSFSFFISLLKEFTDKNIILFVPDRETGDKILTGLSNFTDKNILKSFNISKFFPFSNIIRGKNLSSEIINLLYSTLTEKNKIFIVPCSLLLKKVISPKDITGNLITIKKGENIDREILSMVLIEYGYENNYLVSDKGEYSFRGDIFDIFIPIYDNPARITMWDDYVEDISFFNIETQKRYKNREINEITITQNSEFLYKDNFLAELSSKAIGKKEKELLEKVNLKNPDINISLLPYPEKVNFFDYLKFNEFYTVFFNGHTILKKLKNYEEELMSHFNEIIDEGYEFLSYRDYFLHFEDTIYLNDKIDLLCTDIVISDEKRLAINLETENYKSLRKKILSRKDNHFLPIVEEIERNIREQKSIYFSFHDKTRAENVRSFLDFSGIKTTFSDKNIKDLFIEKKKGVYFLKNSLTVGFKSDFLKISVITEKDIFGKRVKPAKTYKLIEHTIEKFSELKEGDYVVHVFHGIGIYKGLKKLNFGDITKEFILLEYLNNDKLYVPVDKLNLIQKYIGEEGHIPSIDKLGSEHWKKTSEKAKRAAESVAKELLELYAARKVLKGISFKGNDDLIEEFSLKWDYEETPDQLKTIEEVFNDMEQDFPMDRLLCGDVGYGKTEVAIRAILKAVLNGYQVAFLVPTTILALQHYKTLKERFADYPFIIEKLSRFESRKEQQLILENLKQGKVDIVIGTHRLIQPDVKFKNLGFLIVDEEHKFGVKHKEKIKLLKKNLDVLSMTATPIPRTLQMSFLGVKDLSVINTPPLDRQSIETQIIKFNKNIIRKVILKEINRGGQVYFVHNQVKSISAMAKFLTELIPEAKIVYAHGQLEKNDLEKIYKDFIEGKYNVLVCTTIIESGLDNSNANTILINNADKFGISQLYQLRGRVGRRDLKAYAYFIISSPELINKNALKRLKILQTHSGLSQGFKLAMSDLEMRGAGNLFGEKQSGHILSIGFEYYMELLEKAIKKLKGEKVEEIIEPEINYNFPAYIPSSYVEDEKERLYLYKKLSIVGNNEELNVIEEEITDRFGKSPIEFTNLLNIFKIKIQLKKFIIYKADIVKDGIILYFNEKSKINRNKILKIITEKVNTYKIVSQNALKIILDNDDLENRVKEFKVKFSEITD